ncbi:MAG: hypothetical protein ACFCU3_01075 [Verrucomicrobiales bacterium]
MSKRFSMWLGLALSFLFAVALRPTAFGQEPSKFERVMSELSTGGVSLNYMDFEAANTFSLFKVMDDLLASVPKEEKEDMPEGFSFQDLARGSGLDGILAAGSSQVQRTTGRVDSMLHVLLSNGPTGLLSLVGKQAKPFQSVQHAPANADLVFETEVDLRDTLLWVKTLAEAFGSEDDLAKLKEPILPSGESIESLIPKLNWRTWLIIRFDHENTLEVGDGVALPAPQHAVLALEDVAWAWAEAKTQLEEGVTQGALLKTESDGIVIYTMTGDPNLAPPPMEFRPVLRVENEGQRVLLASSLAAMTETLSKPAVLSQQPAFAIPSEGNFPEEGNLLFFLSPRLIHAMENKLASAISQEMPEGLYGSIMGVFAWNRINDGGGLLWAIAAKNQSFLLAGSNPYPVSPVPAPNLAVVGALAGVAIPGFVRARDRAIDTRAMSEARSIVISCHAHAMDTTQFPASLEQLEEGGYLETGFFAKQEKPWLYRTGVTPQDPPNTPLIISAEPYQGGYIVGHVDGSVQFTVSTPASLGF